MICMKKEDILIAREQKLGARDHWALLEHSPDPTLSDSEGISFKF